MVQLMKSGELGGDRETTPCRDKVPVKLEIVEDLVEEEHGPLNKRSKVSGTPDQHWGAGANACTVPPSQYNPLDEPSPLGLRLRKSPSLLDLIQMRLSQGNAPNSGAAPDGIGGVGAKKDSKGASTSGAVDKLKASNFPASLLRIGRWEYKSRYEGDLVAKCYFAKHKLVWEVLDGSLKSKIEIQWSDIMALKANCPDNGPGTLNVVLARQPLFFRETNPQPRKHTLWQATADFTDGQASIHRQHFLQCPQGLLNKHFEKLIQCDLRLNFLSQQPDIVLDSPYFETRPSIFEDPEEHKVHDINYLENEKKPGIAVPQVLPAVPSSSLKVEQRDPVGSASEHLGREASSPSSVVDTHAVDGNGKLNVGSMKGMRNWEQMKVPGLHPSISMSDFMNHIGQCITEQIASDDPSKDSSACQDVLEDIAQYLLTDNQLTQASDEKSLMARVNSLCCLLQKDPSMLNLQAAGESCSEKPSETSESLFSCTAESLPETSSELKISEGEKNEGLKSRQPAGMSRKDSFGELLMHLPRIASLPKFLFNISEEEIDNSS